MNDGASPPLLAGYLSPRQVAAELGVSPRTLQRWHRRRIGPPRVNVGRLVLYRAEAVRAWLETHEVQPVRGQEQWASARQRRSAAAPQRYGSRSAAAAARRSPG